jgi:hypothetical protein
MRLVSVCVSVAVSATTVCPLVGWPTGLAAGQTTAGFPILTVMVDHGNASLVGLQT